LAITTAFKLDKATSLTVAAALAQIGEFSFILAAVSVQLGGMRQETHDLILAAALLSISLNPFVFALIDRMGARPKPPLKGSPEGLLLAEEKAAAENPATA
jgi:CPA2 family monovalent cation:H+ antiporter-2